MAWHWTQPSDSKTLLAPAGIHFDGGGAGRRHGREKAMTEKPISPVHRVYLIPVVMMWVRKLS